MVSYNGEGLLNRLIGLWSPSMLFFLFILLPVLLGILLLTCFFFPL